jgi:hypothetical protein
MSAGRQGPWPGQDDAMHEVLGAWGQVTVIGPLGGGNRNTVLGLRLAGKRLVARRSLRSSASLDWEIALLDHLAGTVCASRLSSRRWMAVATSTALWC